MGWRGRFGAGGDCQCLVTGISEERAKMLKVDHLNALDKKNDTFVTSFD